MTIFKQIENMPSQNQNVLSMRRNVEGRGCDNWWNVTVYQKENRCISLIYHFLLTECGRISHELDVVLREVVAYQSKTLALSRQENLTCTYGKIPG